MEKEALINYIVEITCKLKVKRTRFLQGLLNELLKMIKLVNPPIHSDPISAICKALGISLEELSVRTRKREIIFKRQQFQTLMKYNSKISLAKIGEITGGYDHATVLHSIKAIGNLLETDRIFRSEFDKMITKHNLRYEI